MKYDILFVGGGPAGYEGAIAAGKRGLKTAVVESQSVGGTCLHWGCVPTKALLHAVKSLKVIKESAKWGIRAGDVEIDTAAMIKYKTRVVGKLTKGIEHLFAQNRVELFRGKGKIVAPDRVLVEGGEELQASHLVVCTGTVPAQLPFLKFDGDTVISSDDALEIKRIPERLLVVGAGAVGLELGLIYSYLGSQVTVVEILDQILPGNDSEMCGILANQLKKQRMKIHTGTKLSVDSSAGADGPAFKFEQDGKEWRESFSQVLLSVGRTPNTGDLFAPDLDVRLDRKGFIEVDGNLGTGEASIFACGDVAGGALLAHKASHQAISIVDFITEGKPVSLGVIPAAVFTFPEFATVGKTEEEAREEGMEVKVGRFPYAGGSRSNAVDDKSGLVKIIADGDERVIGAHIVGGEAGELMPLLTHAVSHRMKASEFKELVCIHPTLSENIWEALGEISGFSIHI